MITTWLKGLNDEQKQLLRQDFKGSISVRIRLQKILEDKKAHSGKDALRKDNYALSNWAYLQADSIGYERALNEVISLLFDDIVE